MIIIENRVIILLFLGITFLGCQKRQCSIDYVKFHPPNTPLIYIDSLKGECTYLFYGRFWLNKKHFTSMGELSFEDNAIYLKIDSLPFSRIKYFDFSKEAGEAYNIKFDLRDSDFTLTARVENVVETKKGINVFVFRVYKGFFREDHFSDLVFFVSKENGMMGSYISEFQGGIEMVVAQGGDILMNDIDYSKKEFGIIE